MMSESQQELFQEDLYDAFRHAVKALGGAKRVASRLWPDKPTDTARILLLHCLDMERPEKLDLYQIAWILREANKRDCNIAMEKLAADCSYEARPINPELERDELRRNYIEAVERLDQIAQRMKKFNDAMPGKTQAIKAELK